MYRIIWLHNQRDLKKKKEGKKERRARERESVFVYGILRSYHLSGKRSSSADEVDSCLLFVSAPARGKMEKKAPSTLTINVHNQELVSVSNQLSGALPAMYMSSTYKIVDSIANMQAKRRKGITNCERRDITTSSPSLSEFGQRDSPHWLPVMPV